MKVFKNSGCMEQSAHFGWQNKDEALLGLREGYKESADKLVEIALENANNIKILDTCLLYTSPSPRDRSLSRMPSSA